jgi:hypothetical protein
MTSVERAFTGYTKRLFTVQMATRVQRCVKPGTLSMRVNARLEIHKTAFASALISSLMSSNRLSKDLTDILK